MKNRKGIILAGGSGTRLYPATLVTSKQLLPIYDKPMIYYPLSTLMQAKIRDILIVSTPHDLPRFTKLLGTGSQWGLNIQYEEQPTPDGLAQALIIGEKFLSGSPSALILGDNIFYGPSLNKKLEKACNFDIGATIFSYHVNDPERYGVAEFNEDDKVLSLEEKPKNPRSNYAVTGLYFYDNNAPYYAKTISKSSRGELEITDLNKVYLNKSILRLERMSRGYAWLDTGTNKSLIEAHHFVQTIENRQGLKISCPEEIAFRNNWIDINDLKELAQKFNNNDYGKYLNKIIVECENGDF